MEKNVSFGMDLLSPKIAIADSASKAHFMLEDLMGRGTKIRFNNQRETGSYVGGMIINLDKYCDLSPAF